MGTIVSHFQGMAANTDTGAGRKAMDTFRGSYLLVSSKCICYGHAFISWLCSSCTFDFPLIFSFIRLSLIAFCYKFIPPSFNTVFILFSGYYRGCTRIWGGKYLCGPSYYHLIWYRLRPKYCKVCVGRYPFGYLCSYCLLRG